MDKYIGTTNDDFWGIEEGVIYTVQETYFDNGETSMVLMDSNGVQHDLPEAIVESYCDKT